MQPEEREEEVKILQPSKSPEAMIERAGTATQCGVQGVTETKPFRILSDDRQRRAQENSQNQARFLLNQPYSQEELVLSNRIKLIGSC